jgi:hypothetical protein
MKKSDYLTPEIIEQNLLLLHLKELEKEKNARHFESLMKHTIFSEGLDLDDPDSMSSEKLSKIELSYLDARKKNEAIKLVAPEVVAEVAKNIKETEIIPDLKEAGFPITRLSARFTNDLKVVKHFHAQFPDESGPSFIDKLKSVKSLVIEAVKSDTGNALLGTAMFSVAVATGGAAGIAISGAMYATKLMENKKVQGLMDSLQSKTDKFLVDYGFKTEAIEGRKEKLSEKMQGIADSKWFKAAKITAACCMVGVGAFALTSLMTDGELLQKGIESASSAFSTAAETELAQSVSEHAENASKFISDSIDQHHNYTTQNGIGSDEFKAAQTAAYGGADLPESDFGQIQGGDASASELHVPTDAITEAPVPTGPDLSPAELSDAPVESIGVPAGPELAPVEPTGLPATPELAPFELSDVPIEPTSELAAPGLSPLDLDNIPAEPTDVPVELTSAPIDLGTSIYTAESGDTVWALAEKHFQLTTGYEASNQQIISMINDLNMDNPHSIDILDQIEFKNDLGPYLDQTDPKVYAAALQEAPSLHEAPPQFASTLMHNIDVSETGAVLDTSECVSSGDASGACSAVKSKPFASGDMDEFVKAMMEKSRDSELSII